VLTAVFFCRRYILLICGLFNDPASSSADDSGRAVEVRVLTTTLQRATQRLLQPRMTCTFTEPKPEH
jgi:hypothetical protein